MDIIELIKSRANVTFNLTGAELAAFADELIAKTKQELEETIVESRKEIYYTRKQVAEMLSINLTTLWNWKNKNYLQPIHVGGQVRYRKSDIDRILTTRL
jgi:predicted DNA-binding transcriptional regulator AlpA